MKIITVNDNIAAQNSYLIIQKNEVIIIDPGFNGEAILKILEDKALNISAVLLTHGHFDHIRDLRLLKDKGQYPLYIHELEKDFLSDNSLNGSRYFNGSFALKKDQEVLTFKDNDILSFNDISLQVLYTPGHTKGSCCFLLKNNLFSGDTLFSDSIGRSDLETGSMKDLKKSLQRLNDKISNEVMVFPGHNEQSLMSSIKKNNKIYMNFIGFYK
jgi:glyoxylase-like metal-dependent hydrolase (beta-lactamase superfamily II)